MKKVTYLILLFTTLSCNTETSKDEFNNFKEKRDSINYAFDSLDLSLQNEKNDSLIGVGGGMKKVEKN